MKLRLPKQNAKQSFFASERTRPPRQLIKRQSDKRHFVKSRCILLTQGRISLGLSWLKCQLHYPHIRAEVNLQFLLFGSCHSANCHLAHCHLANCHFASCHLTICIWPIVIWQIVIDPIILWPVVIWPSVIWPMVILQIVI